VRYDTQNGLEQHLTRSQTPAPHLPPARARLQRGAAADLHRAGASLALRTPFKADVVRDRASLARVVEDGGWKTSTACRS
jgi:hypothetical protein